MNDAFIFDALRTPRGRGVPGGALYEVKPVDLLSTVLRALRQRQGLDPWLVDDVLIGCVTPVGDQGYNLARAALLHAGWSVQTGGVQISRAGASGLEAVNLAAMKVRSGWQRLIVAGGVESMSRVPAGSDGGSLLYDPEVITRTGCVPQGVAADLIATINGWSREQLDEYALRSHRLALKAQQEGSFTRALVPIRDHNGLELLDNDEGLLQIATVDELAKMAPAFGGVGRQGFDDLAIQQYPLVEQVRHVHTRGNSAAPADGAALVLVGNRGYGESLGLKPRARIAAVGYAGVDPSILLTGAAPAARQALEQAGMSPADIDLWECNETFAVVPLVFQREFDIDQDRFNANGGAIALGHPLGATGALMVGALLDELERRNLTTGLVALAAGGGMGVATIIERV